MHRTNEQSNTMMALKKFDQCVQSQSVMYRFKSVGIQINISLFVCRNTQKKPLCVKYSSFLCVRRQGCKGDAVCFHGNVSLRDHQSPLKGQPRVPRRPRPRFFSVPLFAGHTVASARGPPVAATTQTKAGGQTSVSASFLT